MKQPLTDEEFLKLKEELEEEEKQLQQLKTFMNEFNQLRKEEPLNIAAESLEVDGSIITDPIVLTIGARQIQERMAMRDQINRLVSTRLTEEKLAKVGMPIDLLHTEFALYQKQTSELASLIAESKKAFEMQNQHNFTPSDAPTFILAHHYSTPTKSIAS
ncbi:uncharacterized protein MONOS_10829 [Monocercomonoides exilis]|uniref:uncharacterized protein n=1 Tax=Monocercomonoides exilis TaxID=2049356 RepID=UPI00355A284B|nr:hypothetical protein MONOS_10829 [Monocercomonoides exilis]|eukprot:MONOS_10829.1-p1 / transcript=MONOS_10829.1 / gene=MONOS_10829 / organism=Monocercomonoides_exilis_PA203 / gene_product=unspecified product / transcript_product=unspecified product / location=Mono_scaffold00509:262-900(+) / protein_length=160 / sequence_SO=supercontig / SO=protein_coding / is_pseudo=false